MVIQSSLVARLMTARILSKFVDESCRMMGRIGSGLTGVPTGATSASLQRYSPRSEMK